MLYQPAPEGAEEVLDVLAYSPLFFDFSLDELAALIRELEVVVFADGEALTEEGRPSDCVYLLVSGQVVTSFGEPPGERLALIYLHPPEIIGEVGLLLNTPRSANNHASGPVKAVKLSRQEFHRLMAQKPQFSVSICRILAARLERTNRQLSQLYATPTATISDIDLEALAATSSEQTLHKTALAMLEQLPPEASELYDLAQTLDARTARNLWFDGASKAYRTAADAIIIQLAVQATVARTAQRGPCGLLEASTDDGQRLTVSDYLWPHNPDLFPAWRLHTQPMPPLTEADDVYRRGLLALVDTLAADTYDVLSRLGQLPAETPLRRIHDFYQRTNDFSVKFMSFSRQQREQRPAPNVQSHNPLLSLVTGIETGMRIMMRLLRLVVDKFETALQRLPTVEEIPTILVPQLRNSHQVMTMLARGNLIDVNTRNRVLMGHSNPWYDPAHFDYQQVSRGRDARWDGSVEALPACRLYPSPAAVRQFEVTPPAKEIVRAVGGHRRTDGCPARAPLQLEREAQELGLVPRTMSGTRTSAKEDANALLAIFYRVLLPLAPQIYEIDLRQRSAMRTAEQARQRQRDEQVRRQRERAQRIQGLRAELERQHPGISRKALERLLAQRLADGKLE